MLGCFEMPRVARQRAEFSTYHIILRGNEKKNIFLDLADKEKFMELLAKVKERYNFHIYTYCLMDNHLHLIIYDNGNDIALIMKSINVSYAMYFNNKYKRVGHLFQDRYKSQVVGDDNYLLELSKYIHNNPVKAKIVKNALKYEWSSFKQYVQGEFYTKNGFLSTAKILELLSNNQSVARQEYYQYVTTNVDEDSNLPFKSGIIFAEEENKDILVELEDAKEKIKDIAEKKRMTVEQLIKNKETRNETIRELRKNTLLKLKDIGELMGGLSESRVSRIVKG